MKEAMGKVDGGLADGGIGDVCRAVLDEAVIELELDEGQFPQARKREITCAEVVDQEASRKRVTLLLSTKAMPSAHSGC